MDSNSLNSIDLSTLNGDNGFVINGIDPGDLSGTSVSNAGDVNGDGLDDIIIGAPDAGLRRVDVLPFFELVPNSFDELVNGGESYLIFGKTNFSDSINLSDLDGSDGFLIEAENPGDSSGTSVSNAGDVNGDGIDDIIVGAPDADPNDETSAGASYVIFGSNNLGNSGIVRLSELDGNNGFVINGIKGGTLVRVGMFSFDIRGDDSSGREVSNGGDVNGDGFDDLIIGAPNAGVGDRDLVGKSYVVFGGNNVSNSGRLELSELDGNNGFAISGLDELDFFGNSVSSAGDVNGDGLDDIIVGSSSGDPDGRNNAGESYLIFGNSNIGNSGTIDLDRLDGTNGFVINGIDEDDDAGRSVSNGGDINGDGFDDLIIGAPSRFGESVSDNRGETYIVFGGDNIGASGNFELSDLDGTNGFVVTGINQGDYSGSEVSNAGDINGDGFADLIIAAPDADPNGTNRAGASYVLFGSSNVGASGSISLDRINGLVLNGISPEDSSGDSISNAGDINGDGLDDLIIGAPLASPNGRESAGESYVVFGFTESELNEIRGTSDNDTLFGGADNDSILGFAGADSIVGGNGDDTLEGGNGGDTLRGGADNDVLFGNSGFDILSGNNGDDVLVGGNGNDFLRGEAGSDRLEGGVGNDTLVGGNGADSFVLRSGEGNDFVTDYFDGVDRFILGGGLEFSDLTIVQNISSTQIQLTTTDRVLATVNSVTANALGAEDFISQD